MIKFLFLITEAIFFLTISLLYYYSPESSYFWDDGFGGFVFDIYGDIGDAMILLTPILILLNVIISWASLIKIKNIIKWIIVVAYLELIGVVAMIPIAFTFDSDASFVQSVSLIVAILFFLFLLFLKKIINQKKKIYFLIFFTTVSLLPILFFIIVFLAASGA